MTITPQTCQHPEAEVDEYPGDSSVGRGRDGVTYWVCTCGEKGARNG